MNKEHLKGIAGTVAAAGAVYLAKKTREREEERKNRLRTEHPGIAFEGEKVVALFDDGEIKQGDSYTIKGTDGNYYTLKEFPAAYNPYLGEYTTPHFPIENFSRMEEQNPSRQTNESGKEYFP